MKAYNNIAIIIYGPPGAGKGTQAQLLAEKFDLIHFDSGKYLRELLYNPKNNNNKIIQNERKINEAGKLNTPSWVLKIVSGKIKEIAGLLHKGVVLSGSLRTMFEALGDDKNIGLMKTLEKMYGRKNIYVFKINVSGNQTIERNTHRLVCSICGTPILNVSIILPKCKDADISQCPFCGGKFKHRFDDNKKIIIARLKEYSERTAPIVNEFKKRKYKVIEIDGSPMPYKIHEKIKGFINNG